MTKRFYYSLATIGMSILAITLNSCNTASDETILQNFIDAINKESASTNVSASVADKNTIVLTLTLENTPENCARMYIINSDETTQKAFASTIRKYLNEGDVLARMVKEKKQLAFQVTAGGLYYHVIYTPQEIRQIAFKNQ